MLEKQLIAINNALSRLRCHQVPPENVLLVFPRCLQRAECDQNIGRDLENCKRCGKCPVGDVLAVRDKIGLQCHVASGGREALALVKRREIKAVIAIACEKELRSGILAAFPKPVIAIPNAQPCGPCKNTTVAIAEVEKAIDRLVFEGGRGDP